MHTISCLGVDHSTASVAMRERVAVSAETLHTVWQADPDLRDSIAAWAVVSTCNRFELYARHTGDPAILSSWLRQANRTEADGLYTLSGDEAVSHLLHVAAGLNSLVLGEAQILGQVTAAYEQAQRLCTADQTLTALFHQAIRTGKRARTETAISRQPMSIASLAVAQFAAGERPLGEQQIVVIGAGEMARLALKALRARKVDNITIINRSIERALALAEVGETVCHLDGLAAALASADAVICATGATKPILGLESAETLADRPVTLIDLGVPRNIDPTLGRLPQVALLDMDALNDRLSEARTAREREVPHVERIIDEGCAKWAETERELAIRPLLKQLHQKGEAVRQRELARSLKHLDHLDEKTLGHIYHLSKAIVKQLLHDPTRKLREENGLGDALQTLFDLEELA